MLTYTFYDLEPPVKTGFSLELDVSPEEVLK